MSHSFATTKISRLKHVRGWRSLGGEKSFQLTLFVHHEKGCAKTTRNSDKLIYTMSTHHKQTFSNRLISFGYVHLIWEDIVSQFIQVYRDLLTIKKFCINAIKKVLVILSVLIIMVLTICRPLNWTLDPLLLFLCQLLFLLVISLPFLLQFMSVLVPTTKIGPLNLLPTVEVSFGVKW